MLLARFLVSTASAGRRETISSAGPPLQTPPGSYKVRSPPSPTGPTFPMPRLGPRPALISAFSFQTFSFLKSGALPPLARAARTPQGAGSPRPALCPHPPSTIASSRLPTPPLKSLDNRSAISQTKRGWSQNGNAVIHGHKKFQNARQHLKGILFPTYPNPRLP